MDKKINTLPSLELCVMPEMLPSYSLSGKSVVVVDVLRATSTIITALAHGVKQVVVTDSLEKCLSLGDLGFITAGERQGKQLSGCRLGNSPREFISGRWTGEKIAFTSSNGTRAILAARDAESLLLGAFLNLNALISLFSQQPCPLMLCCAGKQGRLSPEDLLFAGAIYASLQHLYTASDDIRLAGSLYEAAKDNLGRFLANYAHTNQLQQLGATEDLTFCLQQSLYDLIPCYSRGYIEAYTTGTPPPKPVHAGPKGLIL